MPTGVYARKQRSIAERFWPKVRKAGPDDCWIWTGSQTPSGYGQIGRGSRGCGQLQAHRVSWELANGPIPDGLWVLHKCDNPPCVNPSHLFIGTRADNMRDCASKRRLLAQANPSRLARGSRHGKAKITERDAIGIRSRLHAGESQSAIARSLGVSVALVHFIANGRTWKHVQ